MGLQVNRQAVRLSPNPARVVARLFVPKDEPVTGDRSRLELMLDRIMAIPEEKVVALVGGALAGFAGRHRDLEQALLDNSRVADRHLADPDGVTRQRRLLIGTYLTGEYSIEAAALCNPSIVSADDQVGSGEDGLRFVMSLRGIGEGHISSIEFRTGAIQRDGSVEIDPPAPFASTGVRRAPVYEKRHTYARVRELHPDQRVADRVFAQLGDRFTVEDLEGALVEVERAGGSDRTVYETVKTIRWLASSNYLVTFSPEIPIGERVLVPASPTESRGMEDARFVRFVEDDGTVTYYATYTAYDGFDILPQLIETPDFGSFRIATLDGSCAVNKGMAVFPRRVGGDLLALSRYDSEGLHLMRTDKIRTWNYAERLITPSLVWGLNKVGNCGSPLETEAGWVVLTHGVGPMRVYSIGAMLLDLDQPGKVLGRLPEPVLVAAPNEREGYVPNVVYSCGALIHRGRLVIPYGISDRQTGFATVGVEELLEALLANAPD